MSVFDEIKQGLLEAAEYEKGNLEARTTVMTLFDSGEIIKYPFFVYQQSVNGHVFWVADCPSLKGCTGQGDTQEDAIRELKENHDEWLQTAEEYGIEIPKS